VFLQAPRQTAATLGGRKVPRIAIVCDFAEERWASMDLVGLMLQEGLLQFREQFETVRLCPPMQRRLTPSNTSEPKLMFNADRLLNRFWDYPRWLRAQCDRFDLFHVVDHSYSQLVHHLPAGRTIVTCHDLDAFRSVLEPAKERRSFPFRAMVRHTLSGLQKARWITCASIATRDDVLRHELIDPERISVVTNGVHPSCSPKPDSEADHEAGRLLGMERSYDLLHVGTTIPRKRVDLLLEIFALVKRRVHHVRLLRVGGEFTAAQAALAKQLKIADAIVVLPHLERNVLAAVYRRSSLLLLPSDGEGFGLPVIEAMACGTPVIASDLQVLREVGGPAAEYCAVGDVRDWAERVVRLIEQRDKNGAAWQRRREEGIQQAARFTWIEYARRMAGIYSDLLAYD
jgi:glycosyltransferase involved in cell wall biosynthesis